VTKENKIIHKLHNIQQLKVQDHGEHTDLLMLLVGEDMVPVWEDMEVMEWEWEDMEVMEWEWEDMEVMEWEWEWDGEVD